MECFLFDTHVLECRSISLACTCKTLFGIGWLPYLAQLPHDIQKCIAAARIYHRQCITHIWPSSNMILKVQWPLTYHILQEYILDQLPQKLLKSTSSSPAPIQYLKYLDPALIQYIYIYIFKKSNCARFQHNIQSKNNINMASLS